MLFSSVLFVTSMDRVSGHSQTVEALRSKMNPKVNISILLASSNPDLQLSLDWFVAKGEVAGRINKSKTIVQNA